MPAKLNVKPGVAPSILENTQATLGPLLRAVGIPAPATSSPKTSLTGEPPMFPELEGRLPDVAPTGNGTNQGSQEYIVKVTEQMSDFRTILETRQTEIDEVIETLLPAAQRSVMVFAETSNAFRSKLDMLEQHMFQISSELPHANILEKQQRSVDLIRVATNMRNSVAVPHASLHIPLPPAAPGSGSQGGSQVLLQSIASAVDSTGEQMVSLQASSQVSESDRLNSEMAAWVNKATDRMSNQLEILKDNVGFESAPSRTHKRLVDHGQMLLQTGVSVSTSPNRQRRQLAEAALDELIDLMRQTKIEERTEASRARAKWSVLLDELMTYSAELMQHAEYHQARSMSWLKHARDLKKYVRRLTAEQYASLAWYKTIVTTLNQLGSSKNTAAVTRAEVSPLMEELLHLLANGDTVPFTAPDVDGCDGLGGIVDECGVCGGDGTTCLSCDGTANGAQFVDVCGVCGDGLGRSCRYFCDALSDSGKTEDLCGVCGGNDMACAGCDGIPHSTKQYDTCGTCGGDGSACSFFKGCDGVDCEVDIVCPPGLRVTGDGFHGCCFDASVDCRIP